MNKYMYPKQHHEHEFNQSIKMLFSEVD